MKLTLRLLVVATSLSVFLLPTFSAAEECETKMGWYVPYNCTEVGKTNTGKFIMVCCK